MKLAVPTSGNLVDEHFGHCQAYIIITLNGSREIEKTEILPSPQGCGCKSNIAAILNEQGIKIMLAGNMGDGALNSLENHGIDVYRGCSGDVSQLVDKFLQGRINDAGEGCRQHKEHGVDHVCNH